MDTLRMTNYIIAVVFFVCYTYQFLYIPVPWLLAKRKAAKAAALEATPHNYAVLICARNESAVIADLIGSLRSQTYDQSLLHIFVHRRHLPGQLLLLRYVHGHHARLRPLHRQYPRQPHAGCRRCSGRRQPVSEKGVFLHVSYSRL